MPNSGPCTLKWSNDDPSNAIILTFHSRWRTPVVTNQIRVVFRKLGPTRFTPDLMYVYSTSPDSAIIARFPILFYDVKNVEDALLLAEDGKISREELLLYAHSQRELVVMGVGDVALARTPVTCALMSAKYNFWPSSTFIPLSSTGRRTLDRLAGFPETK